MRKTYMSDLLDEEWSLIADLVEGPTYGFKLKYRRREILNAIFYIVRTGCQWRNLPHDFPPWQTVYTAFRNWQLKGLFEKINAELRNRLRVKEGREVSGAVIDSQSTTEKGGSVLDMNQRTKKTYSCRYPRPFITS